MSMEDAQILERHGRAAGEWRTRPPAGHRWRIREADATDVPDGLRRGVREGLHNGFRKGFRHDSDPRLPPKPHVTRL